MSMAASRAVLRHSRFAVRRAGLRNASSTSDAANAAKDKASQATSKASEGLSRVSSSGSSAMSKASQYGSAAVQRLSAMGGRTAKLVGFVQSLVPPTVYYSRVGLELSKLIFEARKMSPPSMQQFQTYLEPVWNSLKNPGRLFSQTAASGSAQPTSILGRARNMSRAEMAGAGVIAAEVLGFFTVGEMIGRMKVVGYRTSGPHTQDPLH
ncbi:uncharacterized protein K452DRAFT_253841 [Aplosporella prunicola CBS 121167]|uniref:Mitochondrial F1F0-ATP synthase g subunit n=1 Tax=Aplosporella prunicola CBS 121167 TaxID=1176127 RepID=A0A6A6BC83_9PEZI|nr:uncharacterized protein K452DRAFT_253841 [Aplosporella prunicola CBS 121167]KAF2140071.1 hypothetical protein K452DRAFT_253841 [Aplosporella prunicola CBS 121167]